MPIIAESISAELITEIASGPATGFTSQTDLTAGSSEIQSHTDTGMTMFMFPVIPGASGQFDLMGSGSNMPALGMKLKFWNNAQNHGNGEYMTAIVQGVGYGDPNNWQSVDIHQFELFGGISGIDEWTYQGNGTGLYILNISSTITVDTDLTSILSVGDIVSVGDKRTAVTGLGAMGDTIEIGIDITGMPNGTKIYKEELLPLVSKDVSALTGSSPTLSGFLKYDPVTDSVPALDEVLQLDGNWLKQSKTYEAVYELNLGQSYYVSSGGNTRYFNHQTLVEGDIVVFEGSTVPTFCYMVANSNSHEIATWYTESAPNGTTPNGEIQQHCANAGGTQSTQYKQMQSGGTWFPEYYNMKIYRKKALYA